MNVALTKPASGVVAGRYADGDDGHCLPPLFFAVVPDAFIDRIEVIVASTVAFAVHEDGGDDGSPPLGWDRWSF